MALAHSPKIVTDGLVLCLDAGNTKSYPGSGTTWTDLSGNGNNGSLVNGVGYNSGNLGSLSFDGVNDKVTINASSYTWYLRVWRSGIAPGCLFTRINNVVLLGTDGNLNASYPGDYYKASGRWTYFTFVENSGTSYYYMNGVQTGSASTPSIPSGNNYITIGDMSTDQGVPNNRFSNFSLYNRALTASEIQQNFNALRGRFSI